MAYNKVDADGKTLIDLTSDTVTADTLVSGRTAHLANGEIVTGTFEPVTGVKGNAESTYRKGDVNLTPANIGAATSAQGTKADSAVQTIKMNGNAVTKTSGVVDLGTVITAHQNISGKADKSATVSTVTYDTTNKKLTKTINGTTSDVVTTAKLKTDMALSKSDVGLGNVGNFKAVSTAASQGLSDTEKSNARTNIGLDPLGYYGLAGRGTNTTNNPWALIAETTAINSNNMALTLLFDYGFSNINTSKGTGILSVNVRIYTSGKATTNSYVKWLTKTKELNIDDVIVTYNNNTSLIQIWGKSDYPYKTIRVRPLSGGLFNTFDVSMWTFTRALNTNLYESYPTGDGITVLTPTCDMQEQINYNTHNGVKNLLKINIPEKTTNGLTFTPQSDGTIVINGTANVTSPGIVYFNLENPSNTAGYTQHSLNKIGYGNFIMSLNSGEEHMEGIYLQILYYDTIIENPPVNAQVSIGESKSITIDEDKKYVWFRLIISTSINGKTFDNFVLKPMIRDASIDDDTFEPYAKSNVELTQDLNDISGELDCLLINAALVNNEVRIQNTSDFTDDLYGKYFSFTKPKFAILKLQITSNTYYYKALINSSSVSHGNLMEASFITVNGGYMGIYNFRWNFSSTVGTPTVSYTSLNLGS